MKITIYKLLGLVKDDKAPQKIKYEYLIYELIPERNNYYCKNDMRWFTNEINSLEVLNNEVEIIEEPKKIKKLPKEITDNACATRDQKIIANKIDELIDEINKLKEEK